MPAEKPKHPEFLHELLAVIRKHAKKFRTQSRTAAGALNRAHAYAASALYNRQPHRKATVGKKATKKTCVRCGDLIQRDGDGELHHPDPYDNPTLVKPHHRWCHPGGAFERK